MEAWSGRAGLLLKPLEWLGQGWGSLVAGANEGAGDLRKKPASQTAQEPRCGVGRAVEIGGYLSLASPFLALVGDVALPLRPAPDAGHAGLLQPPAVWLCRAEAGPGGGALPGIQGELGKGVKGD